MTTRPHTEMLVDEKEVNTQIEIYIDMIFPHIPCQIVNIDAADILGNHFVIYIFITRGGGGMCCRLILEMRESQNLE